MAVAQVVTRWRERTRVVRISHPTGDIAAMLSALATAIRDSADGIEGCVGVTVTTGFDSASRSTYITAHIVED